MTDRAVPLTTILIYVLWSAVVAGLAVTWTLVGAEHPSLARCFAVSTCVLTGVATTATIRCYVMRVCGLIRSLHGLDCQRVNPVDLHSL